MRIDTNIHFISLDEDFNKSIDYENKHYVIKNSNELLINSLLGIEELNLPNINLI